jgi:hypothetical protein
MEELEAIAGLATLENRQAPLIELLLRVAHAWPDVEAQTWLLGLAQNAYGLKGLPTKLLCNDPLEIELVECLNLLNVGTGAGMLLGRGSQVGSDTWIETMNRCLTALENARRNRCPHALEAITLEVLEFVKQAFFGRALNVAERSALRGLYERQKSLRSG